MGRVTLPWTRAEEIKLAELYASASHIRRDVVPHMGGRSPDSVEQKARKMGLTLGYGRDLSRPTIEEVPSANRKIEDLWRDLELEFERKKDHHEAKQKGLRVVMPDGGPFGLLWFGDPHLGDPGCDVKRLQADIAVVKYHSRIHGCNIGDLSNNWVGNLKRLYGVQATTEDEESALVEDLIAQIPWLLVILGNHDKWGPIAALFCQKHGVRYASHGCSLRISAGGVPFRVEARHQWPGRSQYDPAFGEGKAHFRGLPADLIIGGHTHEGAESLRTNGYSESTARLVNLGAYKRYDEYADTLGFRHNCNGPSCLVVFDPQLGEDDPSRCMVFWNIQRGSEYLDALTQKWEAGA